MCDQRYELNTDPDQRKLCERHIDDENNEKDGQNLCKIMIKRRLRNDKKQKTINGSIAMIERYPDMKKNEATKKCPEIICSKQQFVHEADHTCPKGGP